MLPRRLPIILLLLALPALIPSPAAAATPAASYRGDVNDDGKLDIFDLLGLLRVLGTGTAQNDRQRELANVDGSENGRLDIFDLLALLRVLSGTQAPQEIYWGPPSLAEASPAQVLPGDTVELTFQNVREPVPLRVYLREQETAVLSFEGTRAVIAVPDSFYGGFLTVVSGADTLGRRFLNLRNIKPPVLAGCQVFPTDNPWNQPIEGFPVHRLSTGYLDHAGPNQDPIKYYPLHPDMSSGQYAGMPFIVVGGDQPLVPITFSYWYESDPGPYPIPDNTPIEGGPNAEGDRHTIVLDSTNHMLYEVFSIFPARHGWTAGGGSIFDLNSNAQRPDGWTSADAAGLSILAGVVQYAEVASGEVNHAIRVTLDYSQRAYVYPATHFASSRTDTLIAPMGLRYRLKRSFNINRFTGQARVIARALQKYGMIMADNGGNWFFTGGISSRWNNEELNRLKEIMGSDFEVVDTEPMVVSGRGSRFNIRPGVEVTFPAADTSLTFSDSLAITVEAFDNDGAVTLVEFFVDNVRIGEDAVAPYQLAWRQVSAGAHVASARATDNAGRTNTAWGRRSPYSLRDSDRRRSAGAFSPDANFRIIFLLFRHGRVILPSEQGKLASLAFFRLPRQHAGQPYIIFYLLQEQQDGERQSEVV